MINNIWFMQYYGNDHPAPGSESALTRMEAEAMMLVCMARRKKRMDKKRNAKIKVGFSRTFKTHYCSGTASALPSESDHGRMQYFHGVLQGYLAMIPAATLLSRLADIDLSWYVSGVCAVAAFHELFFVCF